MDPSCHYIRNQGFVRSMGLVFGTTTGLPASDIVGTADGCPGTSPESPESSAIKRMIRRTVTRVKEYPGSFGRSNIESNWTSTSTLLARLLVEGCWTLTGLNW